jgi:hypothetical protein
MMMRAWKRFSMSRAAGVFALGAGLLVAGCGGAGAGGGGADHPDADGSGDGEGGGSEGSGSAAAGPGAPKPQANAQAEETRYMKLEADLRLLKEGRDAGIVGKVWSFEENRRVGIEQVHGNSITELAIVYGIREGEGLEKWAPLPTASKGYSLKASGGGLTLLNDEGQEASSAETEVAVNEYGFVGKPHPLLVQIVGVGPAEGDELKLDSGGTLALVGYMPEMEAGKLSAVYQGTEERGGRECASLDVKFKAKLLEADAVYALDLAGPAYVDVKTGFVVELQLEGKVKVSGTMDVKGKTLDIDGAGKVTLARKGTVR